MFKLKLILLALLVVIPSISNAAAPSRTYTYVAHTTIDPAQNNTNENTLYSYLQAGVDTYAAGSITNDAISSIAAISYSKLNLLNSITTNDLSSSIVIPASKIDLTSPGPIGSVSANTGAFTTLTGANITSTTDLTISGTLHSGSTHQGDVFYDNGTSIIRLTPGTSGQFLQTAGTSANPLWATVSSAPVYAAGNFLLTPIPSELSRWSDASYTKISEFKLFGSGTLRIKFWLANTSGGSNAYGRIYRNGSAVGTEQINSTNTGAEYSEDISGWSNGDLVQLYEKFDGGTHGWVGGMRIYTDGNIVGSDLTYPQPYIYHGAFNGDGAIPTGFAAIADQYMRRDGSSTSTVFYVKTGAGTWTAK